MVARAVDGMRWVALVALALGACSVDPAPAPTSIHVDPGPGVDDTGGLDLIGVEINGDDRGEDLCSMAADLPLDDVCSLICDPDAFAARLVEGGMHAGTCVQLRCALTATTTVDVGVCVP